jgi:hypothetical protein
MLTVMLARRKTMLKYLSTALSVAATLTVTWFTGNAIYGLICGAAFSVGTFIGWMSEQGLAKEVTSKPLNIIPGFLRNRPAQAIYQPGPDEEEAILPPNMDKPTADYGKRIDPGSL